MKQNRGYSLFEMLVSLALFALVITLLTTIGIQAVKIGNELEEQEEVLAESGALLQMICRDLSSSFLSEKLCIDIPHAHCQKNIFFLTRIPSDCLVTVGYFLDPNQQGHCYRFFANATETLKTKNRGSLAALYQSAAPGEIHCELVATHLLSWEITPVWKNNGKLTPTACIIPGETVPPPVLLEINMTFGKTNPHYFLSTVVGLLPDNPI